MHGMEKQLLLVANAHMHWDPEYSDVKLVQTMMFLSEVKNIVDKATRSLKLSSVSGETNAIPLVLCADLNSLPDSGMYLSDVGNSVIFFPPPFFSVTDGGFFVRRCGGVPEHGWRGQHTQGLQRPAIHRQFDQLQL